MMKLTKPYLDAGKAVSSERADVGVEADPAHMRRVFGVVS
jgi:hypothetical protein